MAPAPLRAVTNLLPDVLPFLAPLKWPATDRADLGRAITWTHPGRSDVRRALMMACLGRQKSEPKAMPEAS